MESPEWFWISDGIKIRNLERMPISHKIQSKDRKKIIRKADQEELTGPESLRRFKKKTSNQTDEISIGKRKESFLDLEFTYDESKDHEDDQPAVAKSQTDAGKKMAARYEITEVTQKVYVKACQQFEVVPCRDVIKTLPKSCLSLQNKLLEPSEIKPIAYALTTNNSVTDLDLSGNHIGREGMVEMSRMFSENINITDLNLANTRLDTEDIMILMAILEGENSITSLILTDNNLSENTAQYFSHMLQVNTSLQSLDLSKNNFNEIGGKQLAEALVINQTLNSLNLSWNQLRLSGAVAIGDAIKKNLGLEWLDLSWNGFAERGIKAVSRGLEINTRLQYLNLSNNRVMDDSCKVLAKSLKKNKTLKHLTLSHNPMKESGITSLLTALRDSPESAICLLELKYIPMTPEVFDIVDDIRKRDADFRLEHGGLLRSKSGIPKMSTPERTDKKTTDKMTKKKKKKG